MTDGAPGKGIYAPRPDARVVDPGEFVFAAAFLEHNHINAQVEGLLAAGGTLGCVYDRDSDRLAAFQGRFGEVRRARSFEEVLEDRSIHLVAAAAIPAERCDIGLRVLRSGKDYFTDKSPFTTLEQLELARRCVHETDRKYAVYYAERLRNWPTYFAGELVRDGAIGRVLQMLIMAPHRIQPERRPSWFFQKDLYGGVLTDIGSHQVEQILYFTDAHDGRLNFARVENFAHPQWPGFEDFGEASFGLDNGASGYCRVDWFNPVASRTWGDGRAFVLGTDGYVEVRKNIDVANENGGSCVVLVNQEEERLFHFSEEPFPFFGQLIRDCLERTELAMTQEHAFKAAELSMLAQAEADRRRHERRDDGRATASARSSS